MTSREAKRERRIFLDGYSAGWMLHSLDRNPYDSESSSGRVWRYGYEVARWTIDGGDTRLPGLPLFR